MKNVLKYLLPIFVILALIAIPGFPSTEVLAQPAGDFVPGELIVGFETAGITAQSQLSSGQGLPAIKGWIKKTFEAPVSTAQSAWVQGYSAQATSPGYTSTQAGPRALLVELDDKTPEGMARAINELKASGAVKFVEPNYLVRVPKPAPNATKPQARISGNTNDSLLTDQWGFFNIQANWAPIPPMLAPMIAIIDTGVNYNHPDLRGRVVKGPDVVNGDADPMDDHGHGTHNAGIAAAIANNYIGITGVSGTSKIYAIKALDAQGVGTYYDVAYAIFLAALRPDVRIISLSLGGSNPDLTGLLEWAVNFAWARGKVIVAAAGNGDSNTPSFPAFYTNAMAVTANGSDDGVIPPVFPDGRAIWGAGVGGNFGSWVDISAPGTDIVSLSNVGTGYAMGSGTSAAAPHVAGAAARVWAQNPGWSNAQVRAQLETTADLIPLDASGEPNWPAGECAFGRLNLFKALGGSAAGKGILQADIVDGVSGKPLAGATLQAKLGFTVKGTDIAPVWGTAQLLLDPGTYTVIIKKLGASQVTLNGVVVVADTTTDLGMVPLVSSPQWTLIITWAPPNLESADRWAVLRVPPFAGLGPVFLDPFFPGIATAYPFARHNRWSNRDGIPLDSISIVRQLFTASPYEFFGWNNVAGGFNGARAWVYKGRMLVDIVSPPPDVDPTRWDIGTITLGKWQRSIGAVSAGAQGYNNSAGGYQPGGGQGAVAIAPAR